MKVNIAILNQGSIHSELSKALSQIILDSHGHEIILVHSQIMIVDNNRNTIVKRFLENDFDYLLMIDDDTVPEKNPLELIDLDKDIISCPVPMFKKELGGIYFAQFKKDKNNNYITANYNSKDKLEQIDAGGTGCMLIKRKVLEEIKRPFESIWDEKYGTRIRGSDILFCEKAKKAGFKIWTHWDYICSHYKTLNLLDILDLYTRKSS